MLGARKMVCCWVLFSGTMRKFLAAGKPKEAKYRQQGRVIRLLRVTMGVCRLQEEANRNRMKTHARRRRCAAVGEGLARSCA